MKKLLCVLMFGMVFGQAELTTRVYELPRFNFNGETEVNLDLAEITGFDLEYAKLSIVNVSAFETNANCTIEIRCSYLISNGNNYWHSKGIILYSNEGDVNYIDGAISYHNTVLQLATHNTGQGHIGYVDIMLSVTAEFPEDDTGYIEEGFDYCIDVGANLVASPCRDEMDILDTLPSEIADNLNGIIGQGVATINVDGV